MREYLIAMALLSGHIHGGQADIWYSRACMARELLRRWFKICDPEEWIHASYVKRDHQRRAAAIYWKMCRKHLMWAYCPHSIEHRLYMYMRREHVEERQSLSLSMSRRDYRALLKKGSHEAHRTGDHQAGAGGVDRH